MAEQHFITRGSEGLKKYSYPDCKTVESVFDTTKRCSGVSCRLLLKYSKF